MRKQALSAAAILVFGFVAATPELGRAEDSTVSWSFRNNHPNSVQLEFYSQDRNAAWPGGGRAYVLRDYDIHTFNLNCWFGEKICYGAWSMATPANTGVLVSMAVRAAKTAVSPVRMDTWGRTISIPESGALSIRPRWHASPRPLHEHTEA
jgi:hypothetical protein